jgi:hypothetical protein
LLPIGSSAGASRHTQAAFGGLCCRAALLHAGLPLRLPLAHRCCVLLTACRCSSGCSGSSDACRCSCCRARAKLRLQSPQPRSWVLELLLQLVLCHSLEGVPLPPTRSAQQQGNRQGISVVHVPVGCVLHINACGHYMPISTYVPYMQQSLHV